MVLRLKATDGLFLGGNIANYLLPLLEKTSYFHTAFLSQKQQQKLLDNVPIYLITLPDAQLYGLAYYVNKKSSHWELFSYQTISVYLFLFFIYPFILEVLILKTKINRCKNQIPINNSWAPIKPLSKKIPNPNSKVITNMILTLTLTDIPSPFKKGSKLPL